MFHKFKDENSRKAFREVKLSEHIQESITNKRPKVDDVIYFLEKTIYGTQEDFHKWWIDTNGYIHYGSINPLFKKLEDSGVIYKTGDVKDTMFGSKASIYKVSL